MAKSNLKFLPALIDEVEKREWLWNIRHELYNHKSRNRRSWEEIAVKVKKPVHVVKNKWKNLRDIYRRDLKKYGTTDLSKYPGTWKYFGRLNFLSILHTGLITDSPDHQGHIELEPQIKFEALEYNNSEELDDEPEHQSELLGDLMPKKRLTSAEENDSDMMFLKSLAPYMRQLDPVRKLVVRNKIQGVLISEIGSNIE